jgi:hypothetical protein
VKQLSHQQLRVLSHEDRERIIFLDGQHDGLRMARDTLEEVTRELYEMSRNALSDLEKKLTRIEHERGFILSKYSNRPDASE